MKLVKRDPHRAYLDTWLWVPKTLINVTAIQSALSFVFDDHYSGVQKVLTLWRETDYHLLVPRAFWEIGSLPCEVVDCRPQTYPRVDFESTIHLDHRPGEAGGKTILIPTGDKVQQFSIAAMAGAMGGVLQLACVSGDTVLNLNRNGKGFKTTIKKAYERWSGEDARYAWTIGETKIRSLKGEDVRLQRVLAFVDRGMRPTYTLKLADGKELRLTADHEVLTSGGYRQAHRLREGDEVVTDGKREKSHRPGYKAFGQGVPTLVKVESCLRTHDYEHVYDVVCEGPHHNFVANGIVVHNCGKGKTCIALEHIARSKMPALIVLDNTNLLYQWEREIEHFLRVPGGLGYMMSGQFDWQKGIVLATYQMLSARADDMAEEVRRWFGGVYFDEGHHVSAPAFSKSVDLFYGRRYALTATPEREDGWHIICDLHVGKVLHKDLRQTMTAQFIFRWTGLEIDVTDPSVRAAVSDVNGEIHGSKISTYFGQWRNRLWLIMQDTLDIINTGRKALVLSDSVDEVINLMTMWTRGPTAPLYTEIPTPTPADVGETLQPINLAPKEAKMLQREIKSWWKRASNPALGSRLEPAQILHIDELMMQWQQHLVARKIENGLKKKQKAFLKQLISEPSTAGVMTYGVPPRTRQAFLDDRIVVFAITKYGKEGLDCPDLDFVGASTPFSQKNSLQQLMGRPTRPKPGKRKPIVLIWEDHVGHRVGMCNKLRSHLLSWPHEEGGPFNYTLVGHPKITCKTSTLTEVIGQ